MDPRFARGLSQVRPSTMPPIPTTGGTTTLEVIEGEGPGGTYMIRGFATKTRAASFQAEIGDVVTVLWQRGKPFMILDLATRRGPAVDDAFGGAGAVEEIFFRDQGSDRRIWLRNGTDFRPILFTKQSGSNNRVIGTLPVEIVDVQWGKFDPDYFVIRGFVIETTFRFIAVYKLNRPAKNEPFPKGFKIVPKLISMNIIQAPGGPSFGTLSVTNLAGTGSNPLRAFSSASATGQAIVTGPSGPTAAQLTTTAICQADYAGVAPGGDLILHLFVRSDNTINGPGPTDDAFCSYTVGDLLVNWTRGTVLAAHAPDRSQEIFVRVVEGPPPVFTCISFGTSTTSTGHDTDSGARGQLRMISMRAGAIPSAPPVLNNYFLDAHEDLTASGSQNSEICYPGGGQLFTASVLSVIGEFGQTVATLATGGTLLTAERPRYQASRTHIFWAKILGNGEYVTPKQLFLTDLRKATSPTSVVGAFPELVLLGSAAVPSGIPQFCDRRMVAVRSGLIYAPVGPSTKVPPEVYNTNFFVDAPIDQSVPLKRSTRLKDPAKLKLVKLAAEKDIILSEDNDLQSLNTILLGGSKTASAL